MQMNKVNILSLKELLFKDKSVKTQTEYRILKQNYEIHIITQNL